MRILNLLFCFIVSSILTFVSAGPQRQTQPKVGIARCDVRAYVLNGGPAGVNLRAGAGTTFKVVSKLPTQKVEGIEVHITGSSGPWVRIDKATEQGGSPDHVLFSGNGWISASQLAVGGMAIDNGATNLYQTRSRDDQVVISIPAGDDDVKVRGCDGRWMYVEYKKKTGWAAPDTLCANSLTTCV